MRQQPSHETLVPLPYTPPPQADELISSWIARIASYFNLHSTGFLNYIGWTGKDLDFDPVRSDLNKLAVYTNYPVHLIQSMTLKVRYPKRRRADFFMVRLDSKHLPVYCGACFERDIQQGRQPYWRYHWASIWSTQCRIDRFLLIDNCNTMACYLSGHDLFQLLCSPFQSCPFCKERPHYPFEDAQPHHHSVSEAASDSEKIIKANYKSGYFLEEFEFAMDGALDGIPPGPQWWCGHSASAFRRVATDLVPFIIHKQEPSASPHLYPAKNLLLSTGMEFEIRGRASLDYWTVAELADVSELWRQIALETLARIMMQPTRICFLEFRYFYPYWYYKSQDHHDLLHIFLNMLSQADLQQLAVIADQWPRQAQSRVQAYLSKPKAYCLD